MTEYNSLPRGDGVSPARRELARPPPPLSPTENTPLSTTPQLTPEVSTSDSSGDGGNTVNTLGRGRALKKLQTDLSAEDDEDEVELPTDALRGSESIDFGPGSEDEDEDDDGYYYSGRRVRHESVSKSFTAEEERRVVKKFDRRLTLLMALLYMLSFLDRSSEWRLWLENDLISPCSGAALTGLCYRYRKCKDCRHG